MIYLCITGTNEEEASMNTSSFCPTEIKAVGIYQGDFNSVVKLMEN